MDKKYKIVSCLDKLYWHLVYRQRYKEADSLYGSIVGLKNAKNTSALKAWAVKARRVLSEIKS